MPVIGGVLRRGQHGSMEHETVLPMAGRLGLGHVIVTGPIALFGSRPPYQARACHPGRRIWIAADTDLTNLDDLRKEAGHQQLHDVLAVLYVRHGPEFVRALHGGFAIALWDEAERRLVLTVDRFGIRRLSCVVDHQHVAFATSADALLAAPGVDTSVSATSILNFLSFGYVPAPGSIYRGVQRLPAGHVLVVDLSRVAVEPYWDLEYRERPARLAAAAVDAHRHAEEAVAHAIAGAVPKHTGAFLSGGTDSSTIVGLMSRLTGERVNAFSIGFAEPRYDELDYAHLAARHFNASHYTHVITPREALEVLSRLVDAYDEPFSNDSAIGTFCCARLAAETGITRLVAGDGGDEIFGGNERYRTDAIFGLYHQVPRSIRRTIIEPTLGLVGGGEGSVFERARRYVRRASIPNPRRFYSYEFHFLQHADEFLDPDFVAAAGPTAPFDVLAGHWRRTEGCRELNRLLYLDMKLTIGDNDLYKVTRTAELAGVDVAFPMLDLGLVEFTSSLPVRFKLRGLEKRYLFKRAFRTLLPPATLRKRKHGFGVPTGLWIREDAGFADLARSTLLDGSAWTRSLFRTGALDRLFALHAAERTPFYGSLLWTVLMLELWSRRRAAVRSRP